MDGAGGRYKATRTTRYLADTSSTKGFDGIEVQHAVPSPPGQTFVPRLNFIATPKYKYDGAAFCQTVRDALDRGASFFCDTSLFDDRTEERLWDLLLSSPGRLVIIPHVHNELGPWLATHQAHPVARAITGGDPAISFPSLDQGDAWMRVVFTYYVTLLGLRKRIISAEVMKFERAQDRPPTEGERADLKEELHRVLGSRGYLLARKGRGGR